MSWEDDWDKTVSPQPQPEPKPDRTLPRQPSRRSIALPTNQFGLVIKEMRVLLNLSQSELARRAEVENSFVSRLEAGSRQPTLKVVHRLATAMALSETDRHRLTVAAGFVPDDLPLVVDERLHRISSILESRDVSIETKHMIGDLLRVAIMFGEREAA